MKRLILITTVALLAAPAAFASCTNPGNNCGGGNNGNGGGTFNGGGGSFSGSAHSFAATAGVSFGNGSSESSAGQFAGSTATLSGSTLTTESFVQGFDSSWSTGSALSGALRAGFAEAGGTFWGSADW